MRKVRWLLAMDARELLASRSYWLLLIATCLLVGQTFTSAIALYAEASGKGGGPAALSQGLSPLDGILVPMLGAYDLAATLLFPFVVIRVLAQEKQTGAMWLTMQGPVNYSVTIATKALVLLIAWCVTLLPGVSAIALWRWYGGHLYAPETFTLLLGYMLRGVTTIGIGAVAAAFSTSISSAAIVALAITIGTWALDYVAAARGGMLATVAQYTPWAALRVFERGELRLATILVIVVAAVGGVALVAANSISGRGTSTRVRRTLATAAITCVVAALCARFSHTADVSENRRNSFSVEDARALSTITAPLHIAVNLAAQDPRLSDLEHGVLAKLQRTMPNVQVTYVAKSQTGLFEQSSEHYGEVWYELAGKRLMSRSTIEEVVLETVYELAGRVAPAHNDRAAYSGYPFVLQSAWPAWLFFVVWPLLISILYAVTHWRGRSRLQHGA